MIWRSFPIISDHFIQKISTYFLSRKITLEKKNLEKIILVYKKFGKKLEKIGKNQNLSRKMRLSDSYHLSKNDLKWSRSFTIIYQKNEPDPDHRSWFQKWARSRSFGEKMSQIIKWARSFFSVPISGNIQRNTFLISKWLQHKFRVTLKNEIVKV